MSLPVVVTKKNFTSVTGVLAYDLPQAFGFCEAPSQIVVLVNSVQQSSALYRFDKTIPRVAFIDQPLVGGDIEFRTAIPVTQLLSYPRGGAFPSIASERGLDKLTVLLSQLGDTANFGAPGTPPAGITIPILDARYLQLTAIPPDFNVPRQSQYQNQNYIQNSNYIYRIRNNITARPLFAPNTNGSNYFNDRWYLHGDVDTTDVVQSTVFETALNKDVHQINRVGNTSSNLRFGQFIEDFDCSQLSGKVVTLTVKLSTGTGFSGSNVSLNCVFNVNALIRMNALAAQLPTVGITINPTAGAYTTSSLTFTVPANTRALAPILQIVRVAATSGLNDYVRIAEWQLEEGAYFTGFRHECYSQTAIQCKRYAEAFPISIFGYCASSINISQALTFSVPKFFPPVYIGDLFTETASSNVTGPVSYENFNGNIGGGLFLLTVGSGGYSYKGKIILLICEP